MSAAQEIIERLGLQPHPEGGWYRETWRAPAEAGERAAATAIHFLLESSQSSHWHRVDATEIWLWHAGDPVELALAETDDGPTRTIILGGNPQAGESPQHVIAPHWWQAARPIQGSFGYSLVSCIVSPGFEFAGFALADPDWSPAG